MSRPKVSVVLAVHDGEPWIGEAVESILRQSLRELELIVVDDGSKDATAEILSGFARSDPRMRIISQEVNRGLIGSLNRGFATARGDYVARQDDDDVSLPERLERQVAWLERRPGIGLLGTDYFRIDGTGRPTLRRPPRADVEIRWRLLFGNIWCHASMMMRRELVSTDGNGPYGDWLHAEDYELWIRLLGRTRAATLPEPLVRYRVHSQSICVRNEAAQRGQVDEISRRQLAALLPELAAADASELAALRRCRSARRLDDAAISAVPCLLRLWDRFAERADVDPEEVRRLRLRWLHRFIGSLSVTELARLGGRGGAAELARREPWEVARAVAVSWPSRRLRRLRKLTG